MYRIEIDRYRQNIAGKEKRYDALYRQAKKGTLPGFGRSLEYGSQIIHAMVTDELVCLICLLPSAFCPLPSAGYREDLRPTVTDTRWESPNTVW